MMRRLFLLAVAGLLMAGTAGAADGKRHGYTLVFLGETRPAILRLHLQLDGKPIEANRLGFVDRVFDFLDRDEDGSLSKEEALRTPRPEVLAQVRTGNYFIFNGRAVTVGTVGELDRDKDGTVSRDELEQYYLQGSMANLQFAPQQFNGQNNTALNEELFKLLDRNKDGKISQDEVASAAVSLARLDQNDDELVSLQEVAPNLNQFGFAQLQRVGQPGPAPANLALFGAPSTFRGAVTQVLNAYDKDKNQKLTRAEINLDKVAFDTLDANHDNELDAAELAALAGLPTELEFVVRLGQITPQELTVDLCSPAGTPLPLSASVRRADANALSVTLTSAILELRREASVVAVQNARANILQQFKAGDANKDGFLDEKELQGRLQFLQPFLQIGDRNGDKKLSEIELTLYLDLQDFLATSSLNLRLSDNSQGLFDLLDGNRDGILGQRELRTAWQRVAAWDQDKDGSIDRGEIPRQIQLALNQGQANLGGRGAFPVVMPVRGFGAQPNPAAAKGPLWYRKMDRNADGDVSLREFLGSRAEFQRIDADGDGLIDLAEAEKADAALRK